MMRSLYNGRKNANANAGQPGGLITCRTHRIDQMGMRYIRYIDQTHEIVEIDQIDNTDQIDQMDQTYQIQVRQIM